MPPPDVPGVVVPHVEPGHRRGLPAQAIHHLAQLAVDLGVTNRLDAIPILVAQGIRFPQAGTLGFLLAHRWRRRGVSRVNLFIFGFPL